MFRSLFILVCLSHSLFAQKGAKQSLIAIQFDKGEQELGKQSVYQYKFENAVFLSKEKLMTLDVKKDGKDYMRFDQGDVIFCNERYIVSSTGDIVDLENKKILHDGNAKQVRCSNDSVILYNHDNALGKTVNYFNLKTSVYSEIPDNEFQGFVRQNIEIDRTKVPYKLMLTSKTKSKEVLLLDAGRGEITNVNTKNNVPIYWLNDYTFLFPKMKISNIEGVIVKYDLRTKTAKEFGTFNSATAIPFDFKLEKGTGKTFLEFYYKDKMFLLNPLKETMLLVNFKEYDGSFSVEAQSKPAGRAVYYKGKEVGKEFFELTKAKGSANFFAVVKETIANGVVAEQGLSVYSTEKQKWEKIEATNIKSLVGWIKK